MGNKTYKASKYLKNNKIEVCSISIRILFLFGMKWMKENLSSYCFGEIRYKIGKEC